MTSSQEGLLRQTEKIFADAGSPLPIGEIEKYTNQALEGMDDGELFAECCENETISLEDNTIRSASFNARSGFGMRAILGEETAFSHADDFTTHALKTATQTVRSIKGHHRGKMLANPPKAPHQLYDLHNPVTGTDFLERSHLLLEINEYAREKDKRVVQVQASISTEWRAIQIFRAHNARAADLRPLVRLNVTVIIESNGRRESGSCGLGGRHHVAKLLKADTYKDAVDQALRQALVNLQAKAAPAGEMDVVLGSGWPGILLHEAVGHGLEGDFNRKDTSIFAGRMGKRVASPGVTVIDDGSLSGRRGSLNIDDEGTPSQRTVLIEDGILRGYMQDRLNGRLMNMASTGNGRRQSYAHIPMPRMTNTFMLQGNATTEEMIHSVKRGIYAVHFGGGQVDITSGDFVFSASEAWMIENGKLTHPIKGATLIGNGPKAMQQISMIGGNTELDPGIGICGKAGQGVPVGVGQPVLKMRGLTIGGTA